MPAIKGELVHPLSRAEWRAWLETNHTRREGAWLVTFKKATGKPRVEYEEAVEEALCFGWVDSKPQKLDEERSLLWFAPRKGGTGWSKPNKERVERLLAAGKMAPAGLAKVEAAKADGTWTLLDEVETLDRPTGTWPQRSQRCPSAREHRGFPLPVRRGILESDHPGQTPRNAPPGGGTPRLAVEGEPRQPVAGSQRAPLRA